MNWRYKALTQKAISFLPYKHNINFLFQKYVTKGVFLSDEYFNDRLHHFKNHFAAVPVEKINSITTLELGTGWYPVVPLSFFLAGAEKIYTTDLSPLLTRERLLITLKKIVTHYESTGIETEIIKSDRWNILKNCIASENNISFEKLLAEFRINYFTGDARKLPFAENTFDLIHSNNTFEHIYPEVLKEILVELKRVIKNPGGNFSHAIDMSDHFSHLDKNITAINFLKFNERQWKRIDNSIQPQNRLRQSDFIKMYCELNIPAEIISANSAPVNSLNAIVLSEKYKNYKPEDLRVIQTHIVSRF